MDIKNILKPANGFMKKYKYAMVILLVGVLLMLIPGKKDSVKSSEIHYEGKVDISVCDELKEILQNIHGVGKTKVMLTVSSGEETLYQLNTDEVKTNDGYTKNCETVIITDSDRNQTGLVRQINPPRYLGAIVICEGAYNASVKLAVIDAVSKITGLRSDNISVMKMK